MKKIELFSIIFLLNILFSACGKIENSAKESETVVQSTVQTENGTDEEFMKKVAHANSAEIEMGNMAIAKSSNKEITAFGKEMVSEHSKVQKELKDLAASKKITIPDSPDQEHMTQSKMIRTKNSTEFDKSYLQAQIDDHKKAVELFENEIKNGKDADVVNFAKKNLAHIKMHLEHATKIKESMNKKM